MKPIHLSALGREISLGCLYDYFHDRIIPSEMSVADDDVVTEHYTPLKVQCSFPVDPSEKLKRYMLGINSHIQNSLEKRFLKQEQIWLADYLNATSAEDAKEDLAQVTVFLRIEQRTEALSQHHIESNLDDYRTRSYGQATHLVEKVTYGALVILWFHRKIDLNHETKENATSQLRSVARNLVNDAIQLKISVQSKIDLPVGVSCSVFSTFSPAAGGFMGVFLLPNCYRWLRSFIHVGVQRKWRSIEVTLRHIPEQMETLVLADDIEDAKLESLLDKVQDCTATQVHDEETVITTDSEQQSSSTPSTELETSVLENNGQKEDEDSGDKTRKVQEDKTIRTADGCQRDDLKEPEISEQESDDQKASDADQSKEIESPPKDWKEIEDSSMEIEDDSYERMSCIFALDVWKNTRLIKKGHPNVYLLDASENKIDADLKWFQIGQPEKDSVAGALTPHKVVILMGTVGCGKSTLIDGMVNYILGVRWEDPFRFKITRDDVQRMCRRTRVVTAYTIHRTPGMAIPYSVTIIDTPGYGDSRGVARDKEITRTIHRLLTKQTDEIDKIHAVYFVAASGDSRLTATQRYVIDSLPTLFGNDIKANTHLMVTFADGTDPPIVEACRAANFLRFNQTTNIQFSKFNNTVLYALNKQRNGGGDFSLYKSLWSMNQENFLNTFNTLQDMNGCHLWSEDEMVRRKKLLDRCLKAIEEELEQCFVSIENTDAFRRKLIEFNNVGDSGDNLIVERTALVTEKVNCDEGFVAYNCLQCNFTCESHVQPFAKRICMYDRCSCGIYVHSFQNFELNSVWAPIQTKLTDLKKEYDVKFDSVLTTQQLFDICLDELEVEIAKVLSLLDQVSIYTRSLCPTTLQFSALHPTEYLKILSKKVENRKKPGYMVRLETLARLRYSIVAKDLIDKEKSNSFPPPFSSKPKKAKMEPVLDRDRRLNKIQRIEDPANEEHSPTGYQSLSSVQSNPAYPTTLTSTSEPNVLILDSQIQVSINSHSSGDEVKILKTCNTNCVFPSQPPPLVPIVRHQLLSLVDNETTTPQKEDLIEGPSIVAEQSRATAFLQVPATSAPKENCIKIYEDANSFDHSDLDSQNSLLTPSSIESIGDRTVEL